MRRCSSAYLSRPMPVAVLPKAVLAAAALFLTARSSARSRRPLAFWLLCSSSSSRNFLRNFSSSDNFVFLVRVCSLGCPFLIQFVLLICTYWSLRIHFLLLCQPPADFPDIFKSPEEQVVSAQIAGLTFRLRPGAVLRRRSPRPTWRKQQLPPKQMSFPAAGRQEAAARAQHCSWRTASP